MTGIQCMTSPWHKFDAADQATWPPRANSLHHVSEEVFITDGCSRKIGYLDFDKMKFYIRNGNDWNSVVFPPERVYNEVQKLFGLVKKQKYITHWMPLPELPND